MARFGKYQWASTHDELNSVPEAPEPSEDTNDTLSTTPLDQTGNSEQSEPVLQTSPRRVRSRKYVKPDKQYKTAAARKRAAQRIKRRIDSGTYVPPGTGGKPSAEETPPLGWKSLIRNRYRNAAKEAKRKGIAYLPQDVYMKLWEAAGKVETEWGELVPAYTMQARYYATCLKTVMIRFVENPESGYTRGNVGIVMVKGMFRNHSRPDAEPEHYRLLASWEANGDIIDGTGKVLANSDDLPHSVSNIMAFVE